MDYSAEELKIKTEADIFANEYKGVIAKEVTKIDVFIPEENPVSVFMAGSPGAGKTDSILVSRIHDLALKNYQSFIFDGTFSRVNIARENIQRSLKRGRFVQIFYVYQDPIQAWNFVQKRELLEGRRIEKEHFIVQYFAARDSVNCLKKEFGDQIKVDLLVKNIDGSDSYYKENIDIIDNYVQESYTPDGLESML